MRYAIIANPIAGKMTVDQKRAALSIAAEILGAEIHGLDTKTAGDFRQCARELAMDCDVLVTAGGDGTISEIINSVDTTQIPIAYLPLGTGNSIKHALGYKGRLADMAVRIRDGRVHEYDLIGCDEKKRAFFVSIGIDGKIIRLRDYYLGRGVTGFRSYLLALLRAYFKEYKRTIARITIDDAMYRIRDLLSLIIVKEPYYGFRMNIVPRARLDDGQLHILCVNSGLFMSLLGGITAFTIGNRVGRYHTGQRVSIKSDRRLIQQINGNDSWEAKAFTYTIMPKALKFKC